MFERKGNLNKLKKFKAILSSGNFTPEYLEHHKNRIDCLDWLIASYEGRAGDPKTLLEAYLNPIGGYLTKYPTKDNIDTVVFLYHWVYYKRITGF
jgi:hypothetical protein